MKKLNVEPLIGLYYLWFPYLMVQLLCGHRNGVGQRTMPPPSTGTDYNILWPGHIIKNIIHANH